MLRVVTLLLVLFCAGAAYAEEPPRLRLNGKDVTLPDGLQRSADGSVWITTADLGHALDVLVKHVIPRPPQGKRPDRRREREGWLLCSRTRCERYRHKTAGSVLAPTFELAKVAKQLGMRHTVRGAVHAVQSVTPAAAREPSRARVGSMVPDFTFTLLDGTTQRLRDASGRRVLLVTWASWSATRDQLDAWRTTMALREDRKVILVLAAIDLEGEARVREYAQAAGATHVAIDRHADLARLFPMTDVGRWFYIDELGVLRAEGTKPDENALQWIDLHLDEKPATRTAPPAKPAPNVELSVLRERVQAQPKASGPRLALLDALPTDAAKERIELATALVANKPKSAPFAMRLAALHLDAGDLATATSVLDEARRRTPGTWYLRKQYWALVEPNRFYAGPIDTAWMRKQRAIEQKDFGRVRGVRRR